MSPETAAKILHTIEGLRQDIEGLRRKIADWSQHPPRRDGQGQGGRENKAAGWSAVGTGDPSMTVVRWTAATP